MTSRLATSCRHAALGAALIATVWGYCGPVFAAETLSLAGQWRFCPDDGRGNAVPTSAFDAGAAKELTYLGAQTGPANLCPTSSQAYTLWAAASFKFYNPNGSGSYTGATTVANGTLQLWRQAIAAPTSVGAIGEYVYPGSMGTSFRVNPGKTIIVTQLGFFDAGADGLAATHAVAISDSRGATLSGGSVSIPSGTAAPISGNFRFASLASPLTLRAGVYTVWGDAYGVDHCYRPDQRSVREKWHGGALPPPWDGPAWITLPGTTDEAKAGLPNAEKPSLAGLYRPNVYTGPAWYQRDVEIPENWKGKRIDAPSGAGPLGDPRLVRRPRDRRARQPHRPASARPWHRHRPRQAHADDPRRQHA